MLRIDHPNVLFYTGTLFISTLQRNEPNESVFLLKIERSHLLKKNLKINPAHASGHSIPTAIDEITEGSDEEVLEERKCHTALLAL